VAWSLDGTGSCVIGVSVDSQACRTARRLRDTLWLVRRPLGVVRRIQTLARRPTLADSFPVEENALRVRTFDAERTVVSMSRSLLKFGDN
jgi:hypothetical protein